MPQSQKDKLGYPFPKIRQNESTVTALIQPSEMGN